MNNEIKELLNDLVWYAGVSNEPDYNGEYPPPMEWEQGDVRKLLDCITNLQEENKMYAQLKDEYEDIIDKAIDKLLQQGYLNDRIFAKSYINNQIITTNKGPYKIMKELADKKIDSDIINEEIELFTTEEQTERIKKLINKGIKTNHNRGGVVLKQKIYNDLKLAGYDINLINSIICEYSFENDSVIAKKEYEKLYRKYSRKYSGSELERIIKEKLYQKGLKYEKE